MAREHAIADVRERLAGLHVAQRVTAADQLVEPAEDVVARDQPDPELARSPSLRATASTASAQPARIHAAGVRDDADAALDDVGQDPLHERHEVPRVAGLRIARLLLLQDRHRHLGEVVEHQVVDGAAAHLADRRLEPVAPEALPRGDADGAAVARRHGTSAVPGA